MSSSVIKVEIFKNMPSTYTVDRHTKWKNYRHRKSLDDAQLVAEILEEHCRREYTVSQLTQLCC